MQKSILRYSLFHKQVGKITCLNVLLSLHTYQKIYTYECSTIKNKSIHKY